VADSSDIDAVLDEITRGRTDAFGRVVKVFALPLRSYLASQVHHLDDVDDIAQDVFLTAFRNLKSYRRGEDFGAWLRGIARHKLLNYFRSTTRRSHAMERLREEGVRAMQEDWERQSLAARTEQIEQLLRCIALLPERLRRVVRSGLRGDRPAQMAREFSTTTGAIYNLHYRANQLLRSCLQKGPV
jgi:RNA polymerase sigma-70 factor (ECF subfamily)